MLLADYSQVYEHASGGKLFMGGSQRDIAFLQDGIRHVVNLEGFPVEEIVKACDLYVCWQIEDGPVPEETELHRVADLVVSLLQLGRNVLVHCSAGLNRSGLVCALALIKLGHSPRYAIDHLRLFRHPMALCNRAFISYLLYADGDVTPQPRSSDHQGVEPSPA